jgi:hypothetical protein
MNLDDWLDVVFLVCLARVVFVGGVNRTLRSTSPPPHPPPRFPNSPHPTLWGLNYYLPKVPAADLAGTPGQDESAG